MQSFIEGLIAMIGEYRDSRYYRRVERIQRTRLASVSSDGCMDESRS